MITDTDIKKLKTIFVTKEELQDVKSELKAEIIALRVETKKISGELSEFKQEVRNAFSKITTMIQDMHSCFSDVVVDQDKQGKEITIHKTILKSHTDRIHLLEQNCVTS